MSQKHLKDLLEEDQEPFYLKDYIQDKKCMLMLKKQAPKTTQKIHKKLTKNACFFSKLQDSSPDYYYKKSPLFDITNSTIIPKNRTFLHVPAKTASLLLEAAMKIQQKPRITKKSKNDSYSGLGLFGSMLKRLTLRHRTSNKPKDTLIQQNPTFNNNVVSVSSISCSTTTTTTTTSSSSCYNTRASSLDLESCSSGRSFDANHVVNDYDYDEGFEFKNVLKDVNDGDYGDDNCCLTPFRFASSPVQDNEVYKQEILENCQSMEEDEEEDKEQNSPVSILDLPFEDDYEGHEDDSYNHQQCSFAFVQRAKEQLLHKLQRFEKLEELDPIELEKRLIEDEEADTDDEYDYESFTFTDQEQSNDLLDNIIAISDFRDIKKPGINKLISDLIYEEENAENVCTRLELWKEVECNTIDMMVEFDLKREIGDWKKNQTEINWTANDIEGGIFAVLVNELVIELCC